LGLRFRVAARPLVDVRRTADLVFPREQVAVFLDGCFWHGCPEHCSAAASNSEYWAKKIALNRQRDRDTDQRLTDAGWVVVRVWEHDATLLAADRVASIVRARRPRR